MDGHDLIQRVKDRMDTDELLDALQINIDDLAEIMYDKIVDNADKFEDLGDVE